MPKTLSEAARNALAATDRDKIDAMTDEDLARQIAANPDAAPGMAPEIDVRVIPHAADMTHAHFVETARRRIAETARQMMRGDISFIDGARRIDRLRSSAELAASDTDIIPFIAIESETDALPNGDDSQYWAPDALMRLKPEIDSAEKWAQDIGTAAVNRLIERFGTRIG